MLALLIGFFAFPLGFATLVLVGLVIAIAGWLLVLARRGIAESAMIARVVMAALLLSLLVVFQSAKDWKSQLIANSAVTHFAAPGALRILSPDLAITPPQAGSFSHSEFKELDNGRVLLVHPPSQLEWTLTANDRAVLLGVGFDPAVYDKPTNGADFVLELKRKTHTQEFFRLHLSPAQVPADRGGKYRMVILPPFEPGTCLTLRMDPGEFGNAAWDWIYLAEFRLLHSGAYLSQQFPGFNRYPTRTESEDSAFFKDDSGRPYLFAAAPSVFEFEFTPADTSLEVDYGFMDTAYTHGGHTNGAIFRVERMSRQGNEQRLFEHDAKPADNIPDRGVLKAKISLADCRAGDRIKLSILPGDNNDASWDQTYLRRVEFK